MPITSKQNELVKKIRKLADRKWRMHYGEYVAEGKRWVSDACKLCPNDVVTVICSDAVSCDHADVVLQASVFDSLAGTENNQGIMALMKMPAPVTDYLGQYCLYLDRVRDPGNMGTIIRTACAAGYREIVVHDCVDVYNPKVIRSCMTGILGVRVHRDDSLRTVKENGYTVIAGSLDGANVFLERIDAQKICLLIGNEAEGIDKALQNEADKTVTIPMQAGMESLNAAVSAGILMYALKYGKQQ